MNPPSAGDGAPYLATLGTLRLTLADQELLARRRKELALLAYVAAAGKPVRRQDLATLFWGDKEEALARQSLRQALVKLRRALGNALEVSDSHVAASPARLDVDAARFRVLVEADPSRAADLWRGDYLEGCDDLGTEEFRHWLEVERLTLRRLLLRALESAARRAAGRTDPAAADQASRWADAAPDDEQAHLLLVSLLDRNGRVPEALARHAQFEARLAARGARPSAALETAIAAMELRHRGRPMNRPGSAALLTPDLVGRDAALAALEAAWDTCTSGGATTVLIEGESGSGRSRLLTDFARQLRRRGAGGILLDARRGQFGRFVEELADQRGAAGADPASLEALADPGTPDATAAARDLLDAVASEGPLFVAIDDATQLDPPLATLVASLISDPVPSVLLVLTSDLAIPEGIALALRTTPDARRIKLRRLTEEQVASLIDSMLPIAEGDRVTVARAIRDETGGIPLHVVDMVSALADRGDLRLGSGGEWLLAPGALNHPLPLPTSLVVGRLDGLSATARRALAAAARRPAPFSAEQLGAECNLSDGALQTALGELIARRLLRPCGASGASYEVPAESLRRDLIAHLPEPEPAPVPPSEPARPRFGRRVALLGALAATVMLAATVAVRSLRPDSLALRSNRVIVLPFENRTGDPLLESTGRIAADWIAQGAGRTGLIFPVPVPEQVKGADVASRVAAQAGARFVVNGSYVRTGDSITISARITDAQSGDVRHALAPVTGRASNPAGAIDAIREAVLGALAGHADHRLAAAARAGTVPPSWTVYRAFAQGLDFLYARNGDAANAGFEHAWRLDTTFMLPLAYLAFSLDGQGRSGQRDSIAALLAARREHQTPYEQAVTDFLAQLGSPDLAARYATARRAAHLAPGSMMAGYYFPRAAIGLNRPREAVQALDAVDPSSDEIAGMPGYWSMLSMALHMAGDYERQLAIGRRVEAELPKDTRGLNYQVRALAALGRLDTLESILARGFLVARAPGWDALGLSLHVLAFDELWAHGHGGRARPLLARAVAYYERAPDSLRRVPRQRLEMTRALQRLGRNVEARQMAEGLLADSAVRGQLRIVAWEIVGAIAAVDGNRARIAEADQRLEAAGSRYSFGHNTAARAGIAALQGRKSDAVQLLQQAVTEGWPFDNNHHIDYELRPLQGYPPFEAWLRPKG